MHGKQSVAWAKFIGNSCFSEPSPETLRRTAGGKSRDTSQGKTTRKIGCRDRSDKLRIVTHGSLARCWALRNSRSPRMMRFFCPSIEYLSHNLLKMLLPLYSSSPIVRLVVTSLFEDDEDELDERERCAVCCWCMEFG